MTNVIDFTMFINQINAIDGHLWNLKKKVQLSVSVIKYDIILQVQYSIYVIHVIKLGNI